MNCTAIDAVDATNDGNLDLLCVQDAPWRLTVIAGDGAGAFSSAVTSTIGGNVLAGMLLDVDAVGDFTGDGVTDAVMSTDQGLMFVLGTSAGQFGMATEWVPYFVEGINPLASYIDGDGKLELVSPQGFVAAVVVAINP